MASLNQVVSVIVRSKNESRWILSCLRAVLSQKTDLRIEIILVDNHSTDQTVELAAHLVDKVVTIGKYLPGLSIQKGIESSTGDYIVLLSAHCIPTTRDWLEFLLKPLTDQRVAGVYGRQEPVSFSSPADKRDLYITFGLDERVHTKDPFFHNANSAFLRSTLEHFPFNTTLTNIEDREWAQRVLNAGKINIYQPLASVYHWHGIHHSCDTSRLKTTSLVLSSLHPSDAIRNEPTPIIAFIPFISDSETSLSLFCSLISNLKASCQDFLSSVDRIVFSTNDNDLANLFLQVFPNAFIHIRSCSAELSRLLGLHDALHQYLISSETEISSRLMILDLHYVFRSSESLFNIANGYSSTQTVIVCYEENRRFWRIENNTPIDEDHDFMPTQLSDKTLLVSSLGYGSILQASAITSGCLLSVPYELYHLPSSVKATRVNSDYDLKVINSIQC